MGFVFPAWKGVGAGVGVCANVLLGAVEPATAASRCFNAISGVTDTDCRPETTAPVLLLGAKLNLSSGK
jgi:hypothetical protein